MRKWYPALVIGIAFAVTIAAYPQLPERIPTHWNARGEADGFGSRAFGAFITPFIMLFMFGIMSVLPRIDPRRTNYATFESTYHLVVNLVLTFTLAVQFIILAVALGAEIPVERVIPFGVGALFAILGNVLPRTRSNWMLGIRTPWTLSSDRVWERTHRVGGYLLLGAGIIVMLAALAAPARLIAPITMVAIFGAAGGSVVYSYAAWRQEQRP